MINKNFVGVLVALMLGACSSTMDRANRAAENKKLDTPIDVRIDVPFDEAQAQQALLPGDLNIKGVLYHKVQDGGLYSGQDALLTARPAVFITDATVFLYPASEHLREFLRLTDKKNQRGLFGAKVQRKNYVLNPKVLNHRIVSKTDSQGRYHFSNLKPGHYYVFSPDRDIMTTGTRVVSDGFSTVSNGIYAAQANHYRHQDFRVKTQVTYGEFIELKSGQADLVLESRMRGLSY